MTAVEENNNVCSFEELLNDLTTLRTSTIQTINKTKKLRDLVGKQTKQLERKNKKSGNREPSGFAKPTLISKELSTFLGKSPETHMARTEVTKALTQYIKEHELQDQKDKRKIVPDKKLSKLFNCTKNDDVTYFNLQKWMKPHFSKPVVTEPTVPPST